MKARFAYTGIRVCDLEKSIEFFTKVLGMKVQCRVPAPWNKGEFVNLTTPDEKHWLELNWYADDSPVASPYKEGDQLDHLGFEVDDFEGTLRRLNEAGYPTLIGPTKDGGWNLAFVKAVENIWLDIFKIEKAKKRKLKGRIARKRRR